MKSHRIILFLFVFTCISHLTEAVSYTWTASSLSSNWNDPGNWSPGGVPGAGDDVNLDQNRAFWPRLQNNTQVANIYFYGFIAGASSLPSISLAGFDLTVTNDFILDDANGASSPTCVRGLFEGGRFFLPGGRFHAQGLGAGYNSANCLTIFDTDMFLTITGTGGGGDQVTRLNFKRSFNLLITANDNALSYQAGNTYYGDANITYSSSKTMTWGWNYPEDFQQNVTITLNDNATSNPPIDLNTGLSTSNPANSWPYNLGPYTFTGIANNNVNYGDLWWLAYYVQYNLLSGITSADANSNLSLSVARLSNAYNAGCGSLPTYTATNLPNLTTTSLGAVTSATGIIPAITWSTVFNFTDVQLNSYLQQLQEINTAVFGVGGVNDQLNTYNTQINTCNAGEKNTKATVGTIKMFNGTQGNKMNSQCPTCSTTVNVLNRSRFYIGYDGITTATISGVFTLNNLSTGAATGDVNVNLGRGWGIPSPSSLRFDNKVYLNANSPAVAGHLQTGTYFMIGSAYCNIYFNDDVILESNGAGSTGIYIGPGYGFIHRNISPLGSSYLAAGKTLTFSGVGFNKSVLNLCSFNQLGTATGHTFVIQPGASIVIGGNSNFYSDFNVINKSLGGQDNAGINIANTYGGATYFEAVSFYGKCSFLNHSTSGTDIRFINWFPTMNTINFYNDVVLESNVNRQIALGNAGGGTIVTGAMGPPNGYVNFGNGAHLSIGTTNKWTDGSLYINGVKEWGTCTGGHLIDMTQGDCVTNSDNRLLKVDQSIWQSSFTSYAPNFILKNTIYNGKFELVNCKQSYNCCDFSGGNTYNKSARFTFEGSNLWVLAKSANDIYNDTVYYDNRNDGEIRIGVSPGNVYNEVVYFINDVKYVGSSNPPRGYMTISDPFSWGGNGYTSTFNKPVTIQNASSGSTWDYRPLSFSAMGGDNTMTTTFNDDVYISSTGGYGTIMIGGYGRIKMAGSFITNNYTMGGLSLRSVTQTGTKPQTLTVAGIGLINDVSFNLGRNDTPDASMGNLFLGPVTITSPKIGLHFNTFTGTVFTESTTDPAASFGSNSSDSYGGNLFTQTVHFKNSGLDNFRLANNTGDTYLNDITYEVNNTFTGNNGWIQPNGATNSPNLYTTNVNIKSIRDNDFFFGPTNAAGGSTLGASQFVGTGIQIVTSTFTYTTRGIAFSRLQMNQQTSTSKLVFDRNVEIRNADFTLGNIVTGTRIINLGSTNGSQSEAGNSTSPLVFTGPNSWTDQASISGDSKTSYIDASSTGYIRARIPKNSNQYLPVGSDLFYMPFTGFQNNSGTSNDAIFNIRVQKGIYNAYNTNNVATGTALSSSYLNGVWDIKKENNALSYTLGILPKWDTGLQQAPWNNASPNINHIKFNTTLNTWDCGGTTGASVASSVATAMAQSSYYSFIASNTVPGIFSVASVYSDAGPNQIICKGSSTLLSGSTIPGVITGTWVKVGGPAVSPSFNPSANVNNASVTGISLAGNYIFQWTMAGLAGNGCNASPASTVQIAILSASTVPASTTSTFKWTGLTNSDWNNCSNWDIGEIPSLATQSASIDPDLNNSAPAINIPTSFTIENLTFAGTNTVTSFNIPAVASWTVNTDLTIPNSANAVSLTNPSGSTLQVNGNFTNNKLYTDNGTTIFGGATSSTVSGVGNFVFNNLTINKTSGSTTFNVPVTVTSALDLTNGLINTSATNLLTLPVMATATTGNANSYINGPMKKIVSTGSTNAPSFVFPLGKGGKWARVGLSSMSTYTDGDFFIGEYFPAKSTFATGNKYSSVLTGTGINNVSVLEYWDLDRYDGANNHWPVGSSTTQGNVTLYWESGSFSDINDISSGDLFVARYNSAIGKWENKGGTTSGSIASGNILSTSIFTGFSPITFGSMSPTVNPLPLGLLEFKVQNASSGVDATWKTTGKSFASFELQRSEDGRNFSSIASITANNTTDLANYLNNDTKLPSGATVLYYRLKIFSHGGSVSYSSIESVNISLGNASFDVYPNPVESGGSLNIINRNIGSAAFNYTFQNISGAVISQGQTSQSVLEISKDLVSGMYILTLTDESGTFKKKIIVR